MRIEHRRSVTTCYDAPATNYRVYKDKTSAISTRLDVYVQTKRWAVLRMGGPPLTRHRSAHS